MITKKEMANAFLCTRATSADPISSGIINSNQSFRNKKPHYFGSGEMLFFTMKIRIYPEP